MLQYLGIIEQRTNEILQLYAASQSGGHGGGGLDGVLGTIGSILGQGPQTPAGATTIAIEPPSTTDDLQTEVRGAENLSASNRTGSGRKGRSFDKWEV